MFGLRTLPTLSVLLALAMLYYWFTAATPQRQNLAPRPAMTTLPTAPAKSPEVMPATATAAASSVTATDDIATDENTTTATDSAVATANLSGWVRSPSGEALDAVRIVLHSQGFDGDEPATRNLDSDARGEFRFDDLVAGRRYRLEISPGAGHAGFKLDSIVAQANGSFHEIIVDTIRLVDADGMIVDANLAPIPNFTFRLRSLVTDFPERVISSDSSGYFRLEGFPEGELSIATTNRDFYRIKGLELKADEYRTLTLVVDRGNFHLTGFVSDEYGTPQEGARVTIKSAFAEDEYHSFSYRSTLTDASGVFEFAELGGTRYTLGVYARGFESYIRNLEFQSFADTLQVRLERAAE